jgi:hypothetical protein
VVVNEWLKTNISIHVQKSCEQALEYERDESRTGVVTGPSVEPVHVLSRQHLNPPVQGKQEAHILIPKAFVTDPIVTEKEFLRVGAQFQNRNVITSTP